MGSQNHRLLLLMDYLIKVSPYILKDNDLKKIQDQYVIAAKLAADSGFDAIDIKACHGYLMIEILAAKSRKDSIYGGDDPSDRFRFMLETIDRIKDEVPRYNYYYKVEYF